jgi:hypothetical protein
MKIAFFATMSGGPWGGSEELWCRTARLALARRHQVAIVKFDWPEIPSQIRELQQEGAWLLRLARLPEWQQLGSLRWRFKWKMERHRVWDRLALWKPDIVCVSQGGTFDIVYNLVFSRFLDSQTFPYLVICQHNFEDPFLTSDEARQIALDFFSRARQVAARSSRLCRSKPG